MHEIQINPEDPASVQRALETEWLLTNGLGGYAMGTLLGVNTRRYHGLLVAATRPPVGRIVALHSMIEQLVIPREDGSGGEEVIDLSTQQFASPDRGPMLHPDGWRHLRSVRLSSDRCTWCYQIGQGRVFKNIGILPGRNCAIPSYLVEGFTTPVQLRLRPMILMRDFHSLLSEHHVPVTQADEKMCVIECGGLRLALEFIKPRASDHPIQLTWRNDEQWWERFAYLQDRSRGQDWVEDAWSPGYLETASTQSQRRHWSIGLRAVLRKPKKENRDAASKPLSRFIPSDKAQASLTRLKWGASAFAATRLVKKEASVSVIAGYPWFGDWGRDTMISLPGLMLCTGRLDKARSCLSLYANHLHNGLIPNVFDDYGGPAHYNTADASLWFVHAVHEMWRALSPSPSGRGVRGEGSSPKRVGEFVLDPDLLAFARTLRQNQTDAEELIWALLRDRRLLGSKFRRQHPIGPYVVDFFCKEAQLAVELDGGQHNDPKNRRKDEERTKFIEDRGVHVLRFWDHEVLNSTDAVLESIVYALTPDPSPRGRGELAALIAACREIIAAYKRGTDFNIRMDPRDGLIVAGDEGSQLTWMDAKRDGVVFTPRHGKAVEINALWFNALHCLAEMSEDQRERDELFALSRRVSESFRAQFWWGERGCLHDALLPLGGESAKRFAADGKLRPNQIFAVSLPFSPLSVTQQRAIVKIVGERLLTPFGLRTLDRDDPGFRGRFEGNLFERDCAYHNGTVWPWLIGPYCEALLRINDFDDQAKKEVRQIIQPLLDELDNTEGGRCLGQLAEVYDGDPPQRPGGCPAQAWSVAEVLRICMLLE